jgi:hypothetical protein
MENALIMLVSFRVTRNACMLRTAGQNRPIAIRNVLILVVWNVVIIMLGMSRRIVGSL